jgi:hypothetical protein
MRRRLFLKMLVDPCSDAEDHHKECRKQSYDHRDRRNHEDKRYDISDNVQRSSPETPYRAIYPL